MPKSSILENSIERKFVESSQFRKQIDEIGIDNLRAIQLEILKDPAKGDIIEGTGGVRKIRVAKKGSGKSGGFRVLYLDLPKRGICHLLLVFSKGEKINISAVEKIQIKKIVERLKGEI